MATKAQENPKMFKISVKNNPEFVGKGAGGVQFANGSAEIPEGRMVDWFRRHKGYEVTEVKGDPDGQTDGDPDGNPDGQTEDDATGKPKGKGKGKD